MKSAVRQPSSAPPKPVALKGATRHCNFGVAQTGKYRAMIPPRHSLVACEDDRMSRLVNLVLWRGIPTFRSPPNNLT